MEGSILNQCSDIVGPFLLGYLRRPIVDQAGKDVSLTFVEANLRFVRNGTTIARLNG